MATYLPVFLRQGGAEARKKQAAALLEKTKGLVKRLGLTAVAAKHLDVFPMNKCWLYSASMVLNDDLIW